MIAPLHYCGRWTLRGIAQLTGVGELCRRELRSGADTADQKGYLCFIGFLGDPHEYIPYTEEGGVFSDRGGDLGRKCNFTEDSITRHSPLGKDYLGTIWFLFFFFVGCIHTIPI